MSRRMKSMEEELGYSLFERGRGQRSVELTENGKEFVPVAERLLTLLQGGGGDTEKKEKSASAGQHSEQHCFLSDAGCIKKMMSAQDTCSVEFKTGRSSDILWVCGKWKC